MASWIDFKELRSRIKLADVLAMYHVQLKVRGDRASGFCPLPGHKGSGEGEKRSPSFSCNLTKGIFQCFSCGAKGNTIDLVVFLDGANPDDPAALRRAALKLHKAFGSPSAKPLLQGSKPAAAASPLREGADTETLPHEGPIIVNAPLDFELKHLDPAHPYLSSRGLTSETIEYFGLGYCAVKE